MMGSHGEDAPRQEVQDPDDPRHRIECEAGPWGRSGGR